MYSGKNFEDEFNDILSSENYRKISDNLKTAIEVKGYNSILRGKDLEQAMIYFIAQLEWHHPEERVRESIKATKRYDILAYDTSLAITPECLTNFLKHVNITVNI